MSSIENLPDSERKEIIRLIASGYIPAGVCLFKEDDTWFADIGPEYFETKIWRKKTQENKRRKLNIKTNRSSAAQKENLQLSSKTGLSRMARIKIRRDNRTAEDKRIEQERKHAYCLGVQEGEKQRVVVPQQPVVPQMVYSNTRPYSRHGGSNHVAAYNYTFESHNDIPRRELVIVIRCTVSRSNKNEQDERVLEIIIAQELLRIGGTEEVLHLVARHLLHASIYMDVIGMMDYFCNFLSGLLQSTQVLPATSTPNYINHVLLTMLELQD